MAFTYASHPSLFLTHLVFSYENNWLSRGMWLILFWSYVRVSLISIQISLNKTFLLFIMKYELIKLWIINLFKFKWVHDILFNNNQKLNTIFSFSDLLQTFTNSSDNNIFDIWLNDPYAIASAVYKQRIN